MKRLRQYLDDNELTQAEFAGRMGVSQPTVYGWLSGKLPSAETLKELSQQTGLTIDELLDHVTPIRKAAARPASTPAS
jgi:transcriptional regulator with XRE-family HTH domain